VVGDFIAKIKERDLRIMAMKKFLVLDDDESRLKSFKLRFEELPNIENQFANIDFCKTANDCMYLLSKNKYEVIMLDHDLSGEFEQNINDKNTGSEVARWIAEDPSRIGNAKVFVHSLSNEGSKNMVSLIPGAKHVKWAWLKDTFGELEF
jgi:CheY-like chemotaxis protein